jgi:dTDP-4-dehydrorhamnose reductase
MNPLKVLIVGSQGQLGWELERSQPGDLDVVTMDLPDIDITDGPGLTTLLGSVQPRVIINAAAYTQVDRAEDEKEKAFVINEIGTRHLVEAARSVGAYIIHVSTDFVFDGQKGSPYTPEDLPCPVGVYGKSKLAGEQILIQEYRKQSTIVRTAWLYSAHGQNFVKSMLRLFEDRSELKVVADQTGTPTWAYHLAHLLWEMVLSSKNHPGIYHFTDAGVASWYDFAVAIEEESRTFRRGKEVEIKPIRTEEYPTKARRPPYSVLDKSSTWSQWNVTPVHWRKGLRSMLKELFEG